MAALLNSLSFAFANSFLPKCIAGGCQSSEMAALLNSLSFAFANSFLPKYRVKYYDYVVKWCSGV